MVFFAPVSVRDLMESPSFPVGLVRPAVTSVLSLPDTDLAVISLILRALTSGSSESSGSTSFLLRVPHQDPEPDRPRSV